MDKDTRELYEKYGINPEEREKENLKIIEDTIKKYDEINREILESRFKEGMEKNYDRLRNHSRKSYFFYFGDLRENIDQVFNCLILGSYSASITLTNHILERVFKLALINYYCGLLPTSPKDWNDVYSKTDKYSEMTLNDSTNLCKELGLITEVHFEELTKYRIKIRNGFSHYTPKKILKDNDDTVGCTITNHNIGDESEIKLNLKEIPILQTSYINKFAEENAENYFIFTLDIIQHIEFYFLKKYDDESKEKKK